MACSQDFIEGRDYTVEDGKFVFTARYLLNRGHCCKSGCRHCPWGFKPSNPNPSQSDDRKEKQGED